MLRSFFSDLAVVALVTMVALAPVLALGFAVAAIS
jgi:hypothetical protein